MLAFQGIFAVAVTLLAFVVPAPSAQAQTSKRSPSGHRGAAPPRAPATPTVPVPPPSDPNEVAVTFEVKGSKAVLQRATVGPSGETIWQALCAGACQVRLGREFIYRVSGDGVVDSGTFHLPPGASTATVAADAGNHTAKVAGVILTVVGAIFVSTGIATMTGNNSSSTSGTANSSKASPADDRAVGEALIVLGLIPAAIGLPLWIINNSTDVRVSNTSGVVPAASLGRGLWLSPTGISF